MARVGQGPEYQAFKARRRQLRMVRLYLEDVEELLDEAISSTRKIERNEEVNEELFKIRDQVRELISEVDTF